MKRSSNSKSRLLNYSVNQMKNDLELIVDIKTNLMAEDRGIFHRNMSDLDKHDSPDPLNDLEGNQIVYLQRAIDGLCILLQKRQCAFSKYLILYNSRLYYHCNQHR